MSEMVMPIKRTRTFLDSYLWRVETRKGADMLGQEIELKRLVFFAMPMPEVGVIDEVFVELTPDVAKEIATALMGGIVIASANEMPS